MRSRVVKAATVRVRADDEPVRNVEELLAEAQEAGYRQGLEDGFQAGSLQAGAQLAEAADRLHEALNAQLAEMQAELSAQRAGDAANLVELAMTVAEWVVRRELSSVPEAFFGRLEELLSDRDRRASVEIAVAPELVEATRVWLGDPDIRVTAADTLAVGEARVSIDDTTFFATFADALARAREALGSLRDPFGPSDEQLDEVTSVEVLYDATEWAR